MDSPWIEVGNPIPSPAKIKPSKLLELQFMLDRVAVSSNRMLPESSRIVKPVQHCRVSIWIIRFIASTGIIISNDIIGWIGCSSRIVAIGGISARRRIFFPLLA